MTNQANEHFTAQILVVDDEEAGAEVMAEALQRMGHVCTIVHDLPSAIEELEHGTFDLVITDLRMESEDDGLKVLETVKKTQVNAEAIMVTAYADVPTCKEALKQGAYDFIEKPLDLDVFRNLATRALQTVNLREQNTALQQEVDAQFGISGIIGHSAGIQKVLNTIRMVAPSDMPVLITGESGTGKELVARAMHQQSKRSKKSYKPLNCAGLSESILESELFGHLKGSFTGAERDRVGVFEYADGGTLFLDEIGDMPVPMQAKLLRVLESGEIVRVGDNDPKHVNVRLISATNRDLQSLTKEDKFREDLYFRIKGVEIHLPALRERREDIPLLTRHFIQRFAADMDKTIAGIEEDAQMALMQAAWPGNVRQLLNVIQNTVILCDTEKIQLHHLPPEIRTEGDEADGKSMGSLAGLSLDQIEKQAIRNTLKMTEGNREQAAQLLGIGERTLYRKLKEYGLK